jgi:hypothetical protein
VNRVKHAFALDPPGSAEPTEREKQVVDRVCEETVRRGLATPALVFLEIFRPLNYVGSQALHFFRPIVTVILDGDGYQRFAEFLERRGSIDYLRERIENLEDRLRRNTKENRKDAGGGPKEHGGSKETGGPRQPGGPSS